MKNIKSFLILFVFAFSLTGFSQNDKVKLSLAIKDMKNQPVPGAVVLIDGVKQKRVSNSKGVFKIKLDKAPKEITAYSPVAGVRTIKFKGKDNIIINLKNSNDAFVQSNNNAKGEEPFYFRDIYDYLRGKVPGVQISVGGVIRVRGTSSINGNNTPLFVLNKMQVDQSTFENIVPTTIISVKVLKGPETAIYGLRGAAGVIEVKTSNE